MIMAESGSKGNCVVSRMDNFLVGVRQKVRGAVRRQRNHLPKWDWGKIPRGGRAC